VCSGLLNTNRNELKERDKMNNNYNIKVGKVGLSKFKLDFNKICKKCGKSFYSHVIHDYKWVCPNENNSSGNSVPKGETVSLEKPPMDIKENPIDSLQNSKLPITSESLNETLGAGGKILKFLKIHDHYDIERNRKLGKMLFESNMPKTRSVCSKCDIENECFYSFEKDNIKNKDYFDGCRDFKIDDSITEDDICNECGCAVIHVACSKSVFDKDGYYKKLKKRPCRLSYVEFLEKINSNSNEKCELCGYSYFDHVGTELDYICPKKKGDVDEN